MLRTFFGILVFAFGVVVTADDQTSTVRPPIGRVTPSFRLEVMAVLSKSGCTLGTCHGNQNGKGGLKLSLRGQNPEADFLTLTRQLAARRINLLSPEASLLLQKPLMRVPHEGGRRFADDSPEYQLLKNWIRAGMPGDAPESPQLRELSVIPPVTTLYAPRREIVLQAVAGFTDGSRADVTRLAVFESSDHRVHVTGEGKVEIPDSAVPLRTAITVRYLNLQTTTVVEWVPDRPGFVFQAPTSSNFIDDIVFEQLRRLQINPSLVCDDTTFLRRVFLDLTGLLPTAEQSRRFLASSDSNKRSRLIDELLDSPETADFLALRWADLLRVEDKTLDAKGTQVFHHWILTSMKTDKPLNLFAAEIIAARGSTYTEAPANFYRALRTPEERSESVAQIFLGTRLQCARCHNHPFDRWTQDDYYGWTNFFARVDYKILENKRRDENDKHEFNGEQIVFMADHGDVKNPTTGNTAGLRFLGENGTANHEQSSADRLQTLAAWLSSTDNRRFAETQANRIWFQLTGRGIVDPIDDFRATNPPVHPELLKALTDEFIRSGYRTRHLMRLILNSRVYQLSSVPNETNAGDEMMFSRVIPRRLTAEQMLDGISRVLQVPVPYGGHPEGHRAVQLVGVRGGNRYSPAEDGDRFLSLFGRPARLQTCECERTGETTLAQTMEMISGELISQLLKNPEGRVSSAVRTGETPEAFVDEIFWSALSRPASVAETERFKRHLTSQSDVVAGYQDIVWAVLNSNEFLLRR